MGIFNLFGDNVSIDDGVAQFKEEPDAVLLDVRTLQEYAQGRIPQSVNLPLDTLQLIPYPKTTKLFIYCHSGVRSAQACSWLKDNGYNAVDIGGITRYHGPLEQ